MDLLGKPITFGNPEQIKEIKRLRRKRELLDKEKKERKQGKPHKYIVAIKYSNCMTNHTSLENIHVKSYRKTKKEEKLNAIDQGIKIFSYFLRKSKFKIDTVTAEIEYPLLDSSKQSDFNTIWK